MNNLWKNSAKEEIEREFIKEYDLANKEFNASNNKLIEYYTETLNERKKNIEKNYLIEELSTYFKYL